MSDHPTIDIGRHVESAIEQYNGALDDVVRQVFREAFTEWLAGSKPGRLNVDADALLDTFARRMRERAASIRMRRV